MNPTKVFAVLAAIVLAIVAIFFLTRPDTAAPPAEPRTPDFSLTDTEAITRFEELDELNIRAYQERDPSLIPLIYTSDSKVASVVRKDIRTLRRQGVISKTRFETLELIVVANSPGEIVLRHEIIVDPRFVTESGRDVTEGRSERQTVRVTLHREGGDWLIFDQLITSVEPTDV